MIGVLLAEDLYEARRITHSNAAEIEVSHLDTGAQGPPAKNARVGVWTSEAKTIVKSPGR